ncbi:MAG: hypothetical protein Q9163_005498 [Psora crenata]
MAITNSKRVQVRMLGKLPVEIIVHIAEQLGQVDFTNLACACKAYHRVLFPQARRRLQIEFVGLQDQTDGVAIKHSLSTGNNVRVAIHCCPTAIWNSVDGRPCCGTRHFGLSGSDGAQDAIGVAQEKITKASALGTLEELSITGCISYPSAQKDSILASQQSGYKPRISLRAFDFRLDWTYFNMSLLKGIELGGLVKLNIPIKLPGSLPELRRALRSTAHLETLSIRDIPAREDFYEHLHCIGEGVRSLPRLRHLDLALTNPLRFTMWQHDENFEKPADESFHFDLIFSPDTYTLPRREEPVTQARLEADDPRGEVHSPALKWRPHLRLSSLSLKHIAVPAHAVETVFAPEALKEVDLSYSGVQKDVATLLNAGGTKLRKLTGVDYELLSPQILGFLAAQSELEVLKFMPPTDDFVAERIPGLDDGTYQHWRMSRRTEEIWENTFWSTEHNDRDVNGVTVYPGLENPSGEFLEALLNKPKLRSLAIPADMLDITPGFMAGLGRQLTNLEELEWAFDYTSPALLDAFAHMTHALVHLKKVTFLSLSRPWPLQGFVAEVLHTNWIRCKDYTDRLNPTLKHVRYRHHSHDSYAGLWERTSVYYRRDVPVKRYDPESRRPYKEAWMEVMEGKEEMSPDEMFDEGRTPKIVVERHPKAQRRRRVRRRGGKEKAPTSPAALGW